MVQTGTGFNNSCKKIFIMSFKKIIGFVGIILLNNLHSYAQVNMSNQGILFVGSGTDTFYVKGDFTNTATAALTNNGKFYSIQNLTNDQSSMAIGTGTLFLSGSSVQSVNGSQTLKTYHLVTNNSAGITLNNNLSVSGAHTFSSGLISTSSTPNYLVYEAGSSYSGNNDTRHINGWVKKLGSTNFVFPVGDATYERAISISNLSSSSEFNCKYNTPTNNTINLFSPLAFVKANEYWQLDKVSGGTAQVTLNWDHTKVAMDNVLIGDILSSLYTGGNWTSTGGSASGNVTTTGTITSNAIGSFGSLTFGYTSFPVPLKLLSFSAVRASGISFLKWVTENEYNVDHFDVQRSYDGINYSTIGNVAARNSGFREQYNFEDHSTFKGFAWYRIRSIDSDGKFSFSRIVIVSETDINATSFVVLNPVRTVITVFNKTGEDGMFDYRLFNSGGQLIIRGNVSMTNNGGTVLSLPGQTASGIYILELSNDKVKFRKQVLVEK